MQFMKLFKKKETTILVVGFGTMGVAIITTVIVVLVKRSGKPVVQATGGPVAGEKRLADTFDGTPETKEYNGEDDETLSTEKYNFPKAKNANVYEQQAKFFDSESCEESYKQLKTAWETLIKTPTTENKTPVDTSLQDAIKACPGSTKSMLGKDYFPQEALKLYESAKDTALKSVYSKNIDAMEAALKLERVFDPTFQTGMVNAAHILFTALDSSVQAALGKINADPNVAGAEEAIIAVKENWDNAKKTGEAAVLAGVKLPEMYTFPSIADYFTRNIPGQLVNLNKDDNRKKISADIATAKKFNSKQKFVEALNACDKLDDLSAYVISMNEKVQQAVDSLKALEVKTKSTLIDEIKKLRNDLASPYDVSELDLHKSATDADVWKQILNARSFKPQVEKIVQDAVTEAFITDSKTPLDPQLIKKQNKIGSMVISLLKLGLVPEDADMKKWNDVDALRESLVKKPYEELVTLVNKEGLSDAQIMNGYSTFLEKYTRLNGNALKNNNLAKKLVDTKDINAVLLRTLLKRDSEPPKSDAKKLEQAVDAFIKAAVPDLANARNTFNVTYTAVVKTDATLKGKYQTSNAALRGVIGERLLKRRDEVADIEKQKKDGELIQLTTALYRADLSIADLRDPIKSAAVPSVSSVFEIALQLLPAQVIAAASFEDLPEASRNAVDEFLKLGTNALYCNVPPQIGNNFKNSKNIFDYLKMPPENVPDLESFLTDLDSYTTKLAKYNPSAGLVKKNFTELESLYAALTKPETIAKIPESFKATLNPLPAAPS